MKAAALLSPDTLTKSLEAAGDCPSKALNEGNQSLSHTER